VFSLYFCSEQREATGTAAGFFARNQYLFSQTEKGAEGMEFSLNEGAFLRNAGPPFLVSGKSLASLVDITGENRGLLTYKIEEGDTLNSLAEKFNISVETILWANNLSKNSQLKPGQELVILPVSGLLHLVKPGDTLSGLATAYKVEISKIIEVNGLSDSDDILAGDMLIIPGAKKPKTVFAAAPQVFLSNNFFICPLPAPCRLTQGLHWYNAVDFSNKRCGDAVFAAAGGRVQRVGADSISGNYVKIEHPNGAITFYGHLSKTAVSAGVNVSQGQIIGFVGHTGLTYPKGEAGCHLHFDVRFARNPFAAFPVGTEFVK